MSRRRHTPEQIITALREAELGRMRDTSPRHFGAGGFGLSESPS